MKQKPIQQGSYLKKEEHNVETKRPKLHVHGFGSDTDMEIESAATTILSKPPPPRLEQQRGGKVQQTVSSEDTILLEMVSAGNYTQDEIIQFCLDAGIPLSRMLELDLMRTNRTTTTTNNNRQHLPR